MFLTPLRCRWYTKPPWMLMRLEPQQQLLQASVSCSCPSGLSRSWSLTAHLWSSSLSVTQKTLFSWERLLTQTSDGGNALCSSMVVAVNIKYSEKQKQKTLTCHVSSFMTAYILNYQVMHYCTLCQKRLKRLNSHFNISHLIWLWVQIAFITCYYIKYILFILLKGACQQGLGSY